MKKLNNKGFTLIEILAVVTIMGVLSTIAIVSLSRYREKARQLDYDSLAKSAATAMDNYRIDKHVLGSLNSDLQTLVDNQYLENSFDPSDNNYVCTGAVEFTNTKDINNKVIDETTTVYLCCKTYKKKYVYSSSSRNTVSDLTDTSKCI